MGTTDNRGYTYPESTDHNRLWEHFETLADDIDGDVDVIANPPLVRLVQQSAQSLGSATNTALTFGSGSEEIDTHGFHDTSSNTSRVTPTVAGYYRCRAHLHMASGANNLVQLVIGIAKNGTRMDPQNVYRPDPTTAATSVATEAIVACNGAGDYIEAIANQQNSGTTSRDTSSTSLFRSTLEVEFIRPL